jgi:NAD(P)-dependent dehydrogenase (short-subunit alcohol dehydrogenase family)
MISSANMYVYIVNNAGVGSVHFLTEMTPEHLQNHFGINVFGTLYMTQAVVTLGKMPRGGRIINVGSCASKMGVGDGMGVYGATKAATDYLAASWAWEVSSLQQKTSPFCWLYWSH